ncbi:MBL fold metallo-hydrolase [Acanthopleuribacter pedis]|uniref:MBL fold metallo-hydrolase n=1 Tax=Acanthopleuribacter pedis TaxID=442870 RepID=A0A8J7U0D1_9BACT|nr:MBL fold metallo-hydrolase [Acanthopleuribacter pedis]MBO1316953.1 MBL fold metallo-hydrolase [Acanthopleuribacter pedis]
MLFRQLFDRETATFTYVLADEQTREAVIIDPVSHQLERDLKYLKELDLDLRYCLETHVHADHVTSSGPLSLWTGALIGVSKAAEVACADLALVEGDRLAFGRYPLRVLATPGHTHTCLSYVLDDRMVFTGDALLIRGTGRTDFQSGDAALLYRNITEKLFSLGDDVLVYPGHDYRGFSCSTIGEEKRNNPRVSGKSEGAFVAIMDRLALPAPNHIDEALSGNMACGLNAGVAVPDPNALEVDGAWLRAHQSKVRIIDVRNAEEFWGELGHIPGAELLPAEGLQQASGAMPKHRAMVMVCRSGRRGLAATKAMRAQGFSRVWSLRGGMTAWRDVANQTKPVMS